MITHYRKPNKHYHHLAITQSTEPINFETGDNRISLSDDLYHYLANSFTWITSTLANGQTILGVDNVGVSELDVDNTKQFMGIIQAWYQLFTYAKESVVLPDTQESHTHYGISFDKEELLDKFDSIINLCKTAISLNSGITFYGL